MKFKDRFSSHAADYAQYRPHYPPELFKYLASIAPDRKLAWDCATGSGQAAVGLAHFFDSVIATDASEKQLTNAERHAGVDYRVAPAERSGLETNSAGLITVAQALHWFDREAFFAEAARVLQSNGVLAVWCYNLCKISPKIDDLVQKFYSETVGAYWDFERTLVETGYRTIGFPFSEIVAPEFQMSAEWTLPRMLGYLRTWSATKSFIAKRGFDPVDSLGNEIRQCWQPDLARRVHWPIALRVGTIG